MRHRLPVILAALVISTAVVRAHDPGLSALDVRVHGAHVSATLSLAPADVAAVTAGYETDVRRMLHELARQSIRLSIGGEMLHAARVDAAFDGEGATVVVLFDLPQRSPAAPAESIGQRPAAIPGSSRLSVASGVPDRMPRGHRQLLVVAAAGRVMAERLLERGSGAVTVDIGLGPAAASPAARASSFFGLGVRHILSGYDHLVFLAALLLAAGPARQIVAALTVFAAAHSVSLALVVLDVVHVPASIVEPLIALSIACVGAENLRRVRARRGGGQVRCLVVFGFGLVHGFGLAGALMDLGLETSPAGVALALLAFNGGVEAGQLVVAALVLPFVRAIEARPAWRARVVPACSVLIVLAGGYWLMARV